MMKRSLLLNLKFYWEYNQSYKKQEFQSVIIYFRCTFLSFFFYINIYINTV